MLVWWAFDVGLIGQPFQIVVWGGSMFVSTVVMPPVFSRVLGCMCFCALMFCVWNMFSEVIV